MDLPAGGIAPSAVTWNLNQSIDGSPEFAGMTVGCLTVDLSDYSMLKLGIEVRAGEGTTLSAGVFSRAKNKTLCVPVVPGMNEIPFQDLETFCASVSIDREPLTDEDLQSAPAVVIIAITEEGPTSFDFCVTHVSFE